MAEKLFTIYTTGTCPYCDLAKDLLQEHGLSFDEIRLSGDPEEREALRLKAKGRTSVPQIFKGEEPIGGYEDLLKRVHQFEKAEV